MRDQRTDGAAVDLAAVRSVIVEHRVHYALSLSVGKEFRLIAEQSAFGHRKAQPHARTARIHGHELAFAPAHFFHDYAHAVLGHVGNEHVYRLAFYAVDVLEEHFGHGDLELVALAAHVLYKYGKVHFASAAHDEGVCGIAVGDAQGYVLYRFAVQPVAQVATGDEFALFARERRIVDHESHLHSRLAYLGEFHGLGTFGIAQRVAYRYAFHAAHAHDVAHRSRLDGRAREPFEHIHVRHFRA